MANNYILPPLPGPSSSIQPRKSTDRGNRPVNSSRPPRIPSKHSRSRSSSEFAPYSLRGASNSMHRRHNHSQSVANMLNMNHASGSGRSGTRQPPPRIGKLLSAVLGAPIAPTLPKDANTHEEETVMVDGTFSSVPVSQTVTRPPSPTPTADFSIISPPSPTSFVHILPPSFAQAGLEGNYDVFASPTSGPEGTPTCTFFVSPARPSQGAGHSQTYGPSASSSVRKSPSKIGCATLGKFWNILSSPSKHTRFRKRLHPDMYSDLPLDGEEGELIDDEACYIDSPPTTGIDIVSFLPPEVALHLLSFLDLPSIRACRSVCHKWRLLSSDSVVWRELFYAQQHDHGWRIDERKARRLAVEGTKTRSRLSSAPSIPSTFPSPTSLSPTIPLGTVSSPLRKSTSSAAPTRAPLSLNWEELYKTRLELDRRWAKGEPRMMKLSGHEDSVYCLEFDSKKIVTGSRDRTIKIWDLKTGKLRFTLRGHTGSVLCLKFDKGDDASSSSASSADPDVAENDGLGSGFMVSGSSDCTVLVWDLNKLWKSGKPDGGPELIKRVLKGHTGGVLDLKIDKQWIVSCSKDTDIRVWNRQTLELAATLHGHEGPVNAVGLQGNRVVSASGDGKMMLWDITTGMRIRTFEGHDRGLACIEYKDDLIVSGSNDCKIKLWRASTGECLRTLPGHDLLVRALAFDPASQRLVSASYDRSVKVWDLATGEEVRAFKNRHSSHIFDVKFDVSRIVSTSHDQKVVVLDFGGDLDTALFV